MTITRPLDGTARVVLFSGGMDSALALCRAYRTGPVAALLVDYGQPHRDAELFAAGAIAQRLEVVTSRICVADAMAALRPAERMANAAHVTDGPHPAEVPGRNAILLTLALAQGRVWWPNHALEVWIGATADDVATFVDCTPQFFEAATKMLTCAARVGVRVVAPFTTMTKREMVATATPNELDVMRMSWSCYRGGQKPCGECTPCVLRADAFLAAGLHDGAHEWRLHGGDPHRAR